MQNLTSSILRNTRPSHKIHTTFTQHLPRTSKMPLVVPGITSNNSGDKTEEWTNKLVGKKISDEPSSEINFCKSELPQECRVIEPGMMVTKDYKPERLNVHVKEDGTVSHVVHG